MHRLFCRVLHQIDWDVQVGRNPCGKHYRGNLFLFAFCCMVRCPNPKRHMGGTSIFVIRDFYEKTLNQLKRKGELIIFLIGLI